MKRKLLDWPINPLTNFAVIVNINFNAIFLWPRSQYVFLHFGAFLLTKSFCGLFDFPAFFLELLLANHALGLYSHFYWFIKLNSFIIFCNTSLLIQSKWTLCSCKTALILLHETNPCPRRREGSQQHRFPSSSLASWTGRLSCQRSNRSFWCESWFCHHQQSTIIMIRQGSLSEKSFWSCHMILFLVMTCFVLLLTIQIERWQCCLIIINNCNLLWPVRGLPYTGYPSTASAPPVVTSLNPSQFSSMINAGKDAGDDDDENHGAWLKHGGNEDEYDDDDWSGWRRYIYNGGVSLCLSQKSLFSSDHQLERWWWWYIFNGGVSSQTDRSPLPLLSHLATPSIESLLGL